MHFMTQVHRVGNLERLETPMKVLAAAAMSLTLLDPVLAQTPDSELAAELSPRDRSLVTVSALIAMNRPDQLRSHMARARDNGVTQVEIVETITHLAFYAGWPSAVTAAVVAKDVFALK